MYFLSIIFRVKNAQVSLKISKSKSSAKPSASDAAKFENYIGKSFPVNNLKPHMVVYLFVKRSFAPHFMFIIIGSGSDFQPRRDFESHIRQS